MKNFILFVFTFLFTFNFVQAKVSENDNYSKVDKNSTYNIYLDPGQEMR